MILRVDPDSRLETDGEGSLKNKQHHGGADSSCMGNRRGVLNLVDESCLDCHDGRHHADHGQKLPSRSLAKC